MATLDAYFLFLTKNTPIVETKGIVHLAGACTSLHDTFLAKPRKCHVWGGDWEGFNFEDFLQITQQIRNDKENFVAYSMTECR